MSQPIAKPAAERGSLEKASNVMWWRFVAKGGGETGRRWVERFRSQPYDEMTATSDRALQRLRRHDLEGGRADLDRVGEALEAVDDPEYFHVIRRFYCGVYAYYYYMVGDLDRAKEYLALAHDAVRFAISDGRRHLLPIVDQCLDFRHQRARIARRELDWEEMTRQLEAVRHIELGEAPFCELGDGTPVGLPDLQDFYSDLDLEEDERQAIRRVFDRDLRMLGVDHLTQTLYVIPDMVIPYP